MSTTKDVEKGSLVMTPSGRPGLITKIVFGERGDLTRAQIKYLDSVSADEEVTLPLDSFKQVGNLKTARAVVRGLGV